MREAHRSRRALLLAALVVAALPAGARAAVSCAQLAKVALPNATIAAIEVAPGQYKVPGRPERSGMDFAGRQQLPANPAFCRVTAALTPSGDSAIRLEVWLPLAHWNGKFLAVGNFGWGGGLMYSGMLTGLADGYATASNDTGHDSTKPEEEGGHFALGHPEKMIDYAYRADHLMAEDAKTLIQAYYGSAPKRSYWVGCSLGGVEGLIEAKRYPADFDGIVAGAPPNPITLFNAAQVWPAWVVSQDSSRLIPKDKFTLIHQAVLKSCASAIGQKDGVVDQPDQCKFDPVQLQCRGADAPSCLTAGQVYLMRQIYNGPSNPRTHETIFPGPARGSELDLNGFAGAEAQGVALDMFRYAAFQNPDFNWRSMDWDRDISRAVDKIGPLMHVSAADLKPFFDHGGKLLMYIGWNDYHNPLELAGFYKSLLQQAPKAAGAAKLFEIPGMGHCAGGAGCDTFNKVGAIDQWVDQGQAPERIVASRVEGDQVVRTRPLCAYPKIAKYSGSGNTNDASSFLCEME